MKSVLGEAEGDHRTLLEDALAACELAIDFMTRATPRHPQACRLCEQLCRLCGDACMSHGGSMAEVAETCFECARACGRTAS